MLGRRVTLEFMQVISVNTSPTVIPAVGLRRREVKTCPGYCRPTREYKVVKRDWSWHSWKFRSEFNMFIVSSIVSVISWRNRTKGRVGGLDTGLLVTCRLFREEQWWGTRIIPKGSQTEDFGKQVNTDGGHVVCECKLIPSCLISAR